MVGPLEHAAHGRHDNHCTGDCSRVLFRGFPAVAGKRSSRQLHSDQVDADWGDAGCCFIPVQYREQAPWLQMTPPRSTPSTKRRS